MLRTERDEAVRKTLGGVGGVNKGWVKDWMMQWGIGK